MAESEKHQPDARWESFPKLAQLRAGDRVAWAKAVSILEKVSGGVLYGTMTDRYAADRTDVLQNAIVAFYKWALGATAEGFCNAAATECDGMRDMYFTNLNRRVADFFRGKYGRKSKLTENYDTAPEQLDDTDAAETLDAQRMLVERCIDELEPPTPAMLRDQAAGFSVAAIAEKYGKKYGTACSDLKRGRDALRDKLRLQRNQL